MIFCSHQGINGQIPFPAFTVTFLIEVQRACSCGVPSVMVNREKLKVIELPTPVQVNEKRRPSKLWERLSCFVVAFLEFPG